MSEEKVKAESRQLFEWVSVIELKDLPDTNGIYIVRNQDKSIYEMYYDELSPTKFHYLNANRQKTENVIYSWKFIKEWLKPIQSSLKEDTDLPDWEDLKTDILQQYSDSKFNMPMPFSYNQLYAAMEEYFVQKTELLAPSSLTPKSIKDSEGWISVNDRLPYIKNDIGYEVIVCFGEEQDRGLSIFYKSKFYLAVTWSEEGPNSDEYPNVTHWQPLPKAPEK